MKSIQSIFLFALLITLTISCKNDAPPQTEEKAPPAPKEVKAKSNNTVTAVDKLYRSNEVDTPALFTASCNQDENKARCSQDKLREYIKNNLAKPNQGQEIKKREVISFSIMPDGSIGDNIRSISKKEVCSGCRDAAIKVISAMPKWVPAMKDGQAVAMSMTVPVAF